MEEIRVKVLETGLKATKERYGLDDTTGHMLKMQGKTFPITGVQSGASSIRIFCNEADRSFTFDSKAVSYTHLRAHET